MERVLQENTFVNISLNGKIRFRHLVFDKTGDNLNFFFVFYLLIKEADTFGDGCCHLVLEYINAILVELEENLCFV